MLSTEQKARLHEVADLMLQIYSTLAEMQYIHPTGIICGPHNIPDEIQQLYADLELDPSIIYLYSILPCIDSQAADAEGFFQRSHFFNHMKAIDVKRGRDPWYRDPKGGWDDEDGLYMRPWYTPLSDIWERSPLLVYDAREHRIWVADYENSTDPFFCPGWYGELADEKDDASDWGGTDGYSNWSEKGDDEDDDGGSATSTGSSEFWDDEDETLNEEELDNLREDQAAGVNFDEGFEIVEKVSWHEQRAALQIKNENSLELIQSRDASDVLRDINRWYRELKEVPGKYDGLGRGPNVEGKTRRLLYKKHGWPDSFNANAFTVALIRASATERIARDASERDPMEILSKCKKHLERRERYRMKFMDPVEAAKGADEEWIARFTLLNFDLDMTRHERDMNEAEEALARGSTMDERSDEELAALREYEMLRDDLESHRQRASRWDHTLNSHDATNENYRHWETLRSHVVRLIPFHETALVEARADAQRVSPDKFVRPGVMSKIESKKKLVALWAKDLRRMKDFLSDVPVNAVKAREKVADDVEGLEKAVRDAQASIVELEKSLQDDRYEN